MQRRIEPEILDELPPSDPRAIHSRADLHRLNWLMRHVDILRANAANRLPHAPKHLVDLGAGDGSMMLALAKKMHRQWPGVCVTLVDRQQTVPPAKLEQFRELGWQAEAVAADVFDWLKSSHRTDAIFANLFLHHFPDEKLAEMFRLIADRTDLFVSCETRRTAPSFLVARLLWLFGCNAVTRHDAVLSMRSGFTGQELSSLWPKGDGWSMDERVTIVFTHLFAARRAA
jgi:ubiquinone/menaquinone biosynthesis C-methylase UbiE